MLNKLNAYTLVEILIVIGLTLFLFSAAIQSFIANSSQFTFTNSVEKVNSLIRQARSLAISAKALPDYTGFAGSISGQVTPANYGVYFEHNDSGADTVALFADNHKAVTGKEGVFEPGANEDEYKNGYDIVLERYDLPAGIKLINLPVETLAPCAGLVKKPADWCISVFYSPVFADLNFNPEPSSSSVIFGVKQTDFAVSRERCFILHKLAGNLEPISCLSS